MQDRFSFYIYMFWNNNKYIMSISVWALNNHNFVETFPSHNNKLLLPSCNFFDRINYSYIAVPYANCRVYNTALANYVSLRAPKFWSSQENFASFDWSQLWREVQPLSCKSRTFVLHTSKLHLYRLWCFLMQNNMYITELNSSLILWSTISCVYFEGL